MLMVLPQGYYSLWSWGGCLLGLEALDPSSGRYIPVIDPMLALAPASSGYSVFFKSAGDPFCLCSSLVVSCSTAIFSFLFGCRENTLTTLSSSFVPQIHLLNLYSLLIPQFIYICIAGSRNQELLPYHQSISTPSQEDSQALVRTS
ncbi:hypothetical protein POTOM_009071 [Populus tomentosa]|uniref:Uncharacterized protein n=1 Tax=Populus tomentosa TaxID=118781 RepID=A0A8X8DD00_POPTO|nr:hypothetical protein POTOM_009071 [Populus tomentosa]